jgi:anti-anti-sigma factor
VVRDGDSPGGDTVAPLHRDGVRRASITLFQETVVLAVTGQLNADTAGRLRMFLTMFTVDGGPRELVLDLAGIHAVDEAGMGPIHEADEAMRLRSASLRLVSLSPAVTHLLQDLRRTETFPHEVIPLDESVLDDEDDVPERD